MSNLDFLSSFCSLHVLSVAAGRCSYPPSLFHDLNDLPDNEGLFQEVGSGLHRAVGLQAPSLAAGPRFSWTVGVNPEGPTLPLTVIWLDFQSPAEQMLLRSYCNSLVFLIITLMFPRIIGSVYVVLAPCKLI